MPPTKFRSYAVNIILILLSTVVSVVVLEIILRFTPLVDKLPYRYAPPLGYHIPDRELVYDISPNFPTTTYRFKDGEFKIWSNGLGCFDREYNQETPYLLLLGDSFTWGIVPFEDKWGTVLEKSIGVRTLKCGVPGYGTRQELIKGTRLLDSLPSPRMIIVGYFDNDLSDDARIPEGEDVSQYPDWEKKYCTFNKPSHLFVQRTKCILSRHSVIYALSKPVLKDFISDKFMENTGLVIPQANIQESRKVHYQNISKLKELALSKNSSILIVFIPTPLFLDLDADPYYDVKEYMNKKNIEYFDLRNDFKSVLGGNYNGYLYWPKDEHWSPAGNRLAGLLISKYLLENGYFQDKITLDMVRENLEKEFGIK